MPDVRNATLESDGWHVTEPEPDCAVMGPNTLEKALGPQGYVVAYQPEECADGVTKPVAEFSADDTSITVGGTVEFTDESTNDPTAWLWDFGDGNTSILQNPTHTYSASGTYSVTLTAINAAGNDGESKSGYITVEEAPEYVGPLDLVPGAVVAVDQFAPSAAYLGQPFATIGGVVYNYDASTGLGTALAGAVSAYSGGPIAFAQATAGKRPTWAANQFGSVGAFVFSAASAQCLFSDGDISLPDGAYTIIKVLNLTNADSVQHGAICGINATQYSGGGAAQVFWDEATRFSPELLDYTLVVQSTSDGNNGNGIFWFTDQPVENFAGSARLVVSKIQYSSGVIEVDGVSIDTAENNFGDVVGAISGPMAIGCNDVVNAAADSYINGKIAALYIYNGIISAPNVALISELLASRYGITL